MADKMKTSEKPEGSNTFVQELAPGVKFIIKAGSNKIEIDSTGVKITTNMLTLEGDNVTIKGKTIIIEGDAITTKGPITVT